MLTNVHNVTWGKEAMVPLPGSCPDGAITCQPRATPWGPDTQQKPRPARAENRQLSALARIRWRTRDNLEAEPVRPLPGQSGLFLLRNETVLSDVVWLRKA
jgi:hypothetical protein